MEFTMKNNDNDSFYEGIYDMDLYISLLKSLNKISKKYDDTEYHVIATISQVLAYFIRNDDLEALEEDLLPKFLEIMEKLSMDKYRE